MTMKKFERLRHIRYFTNSLQKLPKQYSSADTNRLTLVHFCVQALDILGCLPDYADCCGRVEEEVYIHNREEIIEWIYGLQTLPTAVDSGESSSYASDFIGGGFKGGTYLGPLPNNANASSDNTTSSDCDEEEVHQQRSIAMEEEEEHHPYDHSHLAMTYVALCTLVSLGDDLSRVYKTAILQTLQSLQKEDGSFVAIISSNNSCNSSKANSIHEHEPADAVKEDDDCDLRFMYLAIVTWYLLTKNSETDNSSSSAISINIESATSYILSCIAYDGSLGLTPGREGHGGSTFCGIASLYLMGVLDDVMARDELRGWKEDLIRWCVMRQYSLHPQRRDGDDDGKENNGYCDVDGAAGMQGRPNKLQDTCYSYWIGGTLHLLSESHLLDGWALREYVLTCQSPYGGFGKVVGAMPDVLHSFYSLAWLALSKEQGCCDEEEEAGNENDDSSVGAGEFVGYDSEMRQQVCESINQLSRLDCALGMCTKRKQTFQKASMHGSTKV